MLMYPVFVTDDPDASSIIQSLPGQRRWGVNKLEEFIGPLVKKGLKSVILYGVPFNCAKDLDGTPADDQQGPVILAVKKLKKLFPSLYIACDACICEYASHGHCGLLNEDGTINILPSVERVSDVALAYAKAGADCVARSNMMDGTVLAIKKKFINAGYGNKCTIMSFVKFESGLYGPFLEAAGGGADSGDRKCYQLPPPTKGLAIRAVRRDIDEGADMVIIKPGGLYLDIIAEASRAAPDHPLAAFQVGGEFAMITAGAKAGVFDLKTMVFESTQAFLRAGCSVIISYFTPDFLDWLEV